MGRNELLKVVKGAAVVLAAGGAVAACGGAVSQSAHHSAPPAKKATTTASHGGTKVATGGSAGSGGTTKSSGSNGTGATGSGGSSSSSSSGSGSTQPSGTLLGYGAEGSASEIPWSDVNSGWTLALWGQTSTSRKELFAVDPEGGRYLVASGLPEWASIVGWSGDTQRVMIESSDNGLQARTVTEYDLANGAVLNQFQIGSNVLGISYTQPHGLAVLRVLQAKSAGAPEQLQRTDLAGNVEMSFPMTFGDGLGNFTGSAMETPDGTEIVMGATKGLAIVGNDGSIVSRIRIPGTVNCQPVHWWSADVALVMCSQTQNGPATQGIYWTVPISGGAPTELPEAYNPAVDVYQLADGAAYGQGAACGVEWIEQLGSANPPRITPPGTSDLATDEIVGTVGNDLIVNVMGSCDMPAHAKPVSELLYFDPQSGSVQALLGGPINGGFVTSVTQFGNTADGLGYAF
jgi:TolB protein